MADGNTATLERALRRIGETTSAGRWDYRLGGKDNYAPDRALIEDAAEYYPAVRRAAMASRAFAERAVRHLAEKGIEQIIDLGSGRPVPTSVVHDVVPGARVVYVDNDAVVAAWCRAMLKTAEPCRTDTLEWDIRDLPGILDHVTTRSLIDLEKPVGVLLCNVLDEREEDEDENWPMEVMATLRHALVPGSCVVLAHALLTPETEAAAKITGTDVPRTEEEIAALMAGFELAEPGLVAVDRWRPRPVGDDDPPVPVLAAVAIQPA